LDQVERHGADPELFAGLVHTCRYCGLYEQAVAAHEEARRLDPNVPTSVAQTLLMKGELDTILAGGRSRTVGGVDDPVRIIALGLKGNRDEARRALTELRGEAGVLPSFQAWANLLMAWLDRNPADVLARIAALGAWRVMEDSESIFTCGWLLCDAGDHASGMDHLRRAVAGGYYAAPTLSWSRSFDAVRDSVAFRELLEHAEAGRRQALAAFHERHGERLLGR
jgi:hypothetical protein